MPFFDVSETSTTWKFTITVTQKYKDFSGEHVAKRKRSQLAVGADRVGKRFRGVGCFFERN